MGTGIVLLLPAVAAGNVAGNERDAN